MKRMMIEYWWVALLSLILVILLSFTIGRVHMNRKIAKEIHALFSDIDSLDQTSTPLITEDDLADLPHPVQQWLITTGVVNQPKIRAVTLSQRGKMRLDPDDDTWLKPQAKQYIRIDKPGYLWHVDLPVLPLLNTKGRDLFYQGEASMIIRLGHLISVVDEDNNPKLDESALHRFLLELPWYPTAALEDYITWTPMDGASAKATLTQYGHTVSATFYFDDDFRLLKIEALRYKDHDANAKRIPCIGEVKGHTTIEGMLIPHRFEVTWVLEDEAFTWYKLENHEIRFHQP